MVSLGVNIIPLAPVSKLVELAKEAERLGYCKFWVMDEGLAGRDVYITLAAIAQNTRSILVGTGITNPYTRHPAITAASIATLDELSGGRAFLGLGAGGSLTLDPLTIQRLKPLTALSEQVEITRALYKGEVVNYQGEFIQLADAHIDYASSSGIEIWIAGRGPKILTLGGKVADGVQLSFIHKELIQDVIDLIVSGAGQTGNKPKIGYATFVFTNQKLLETLKPYLTFSLVDSSPEAKEMIGIKEEEVNLIRQAMGSEGLHEAGKLLKDEWLRPFIIMGSKAECSLEIKALVSRYKIDELVLPIYDMDTALELMLDLADVWKGE
jgi:5,10-methylenetetrahydromethanopterin reductase